MTLQSSGKTALETGIVHPFKNLMLISEMFIMFYCFHEISFKIKAPLRLVLVGFMCKVYALVYHCLPMHHRCLICVCGDM